jgi:hypothetical protein
VFDPGYLPETLWSLPYSKRKVDVSGLLGPEDTIIAVAKGMRPGALIALEDRATIKGGLMALRAAGLSKTDPINLKVTTLNLPKHDQELIRAAGLKSGTLQAAAAKVRAAVAKQGKGLARAAWGARGLLILSTMAGFSAGRAVTATSLAVIPLGVTQIIGAAVAAHGAVSGAIAKSLSDKFTTYVKDGLAQQQRQVKKQAEAKAAAAKKTAISRPVSAAAAPAAAPASSVPTWAWWGGGAALLAVVGLLAAKKAGRPT